MFTSEPSLIQRIERMINETPIVNSHAQIRCGQPAVPDLASLLSDSTIQTDLLAVGMPSEDFDSGLPPDERVRRAIPFLSRIRNTGAAWCFYRVLRDLHDFYDPDLTEFNYREVLDRISRAGADPDWAPELLRNRYNFRTVVTSLGHRSADDQRDSSIFCFRLDVQYLFSPGLQKNWPPSSRAERPEKNTMKPLFSSSASVPGRSIGSSGCSMSG